MLARDIEMFIECCGLKGLSTKTINSYEQTLRLFMQYMDEQGILLTEKITHLAIQGYIKSIKERGKYTVTTNPNSGNYPDRRVDFGKRVSDVTINNYLRNLRVFFNWCVEEELILRSPVKKGDFVKVERKPLEFVSDEDFKRLLKSMNSASFSEYRDSIIIQLLLDFGSFVELVTRLNDEQNYRMWYRGQSNYLWGLVPSVQRKKNMGEHYEQYITTNFMIQTMRLNPNAPQRYNRAAWLTLMQHYGLPTRLLDWSESPLIALYFALNSQENVDAAVWVMNPMKLNQKAGYGEYVPPINYDSLKDDLEGAFSNKIEEDNQGQNRIVACHGVGNDLRMYVQQSDFTIHSSAEQLDQLLFSDESCDYVYKIRIPKQIRPKLLYQLDAMGFHESSIYPDMEHIAKEQASSCFNF